MLVYYVRTATVRKCTFFNVLTECSLTKQYKISVVLVTEVLSNYKLLEIKLFES
jgi:hypothetical protein